MQIFNYINDLDRLQAPSPAFLKGLQSLRETTRSSASGTLLG